MPACDGELRLEGVSDLMKIQVRVGPSRIAGQGLFAAQDIPKGTRIIQYIGEKISSRERAAFSCWQCLHLSSDVPVCA
jgi:hypothetical protein